MAYKTILAYLPTSRRAAQIADAAVKAASLQDAHIIGLHVMATFPSYADFPRYADLDKELRSDWMKKLREPAEREAEAVKIIFDNATGSAPVTAEWRCLAADYGQVTDLVVQEARAAQLVVCGYHETEDPFHSWVDTLDRLMMESGRPVLYMPQAQAQAPERLGERVLIAWNNTREAARAAFDALDLLGPQSIVQILAINPPGAEGDVYANGARLLSNLQRRGIKASAEAAIVDDATAGEYLVSRINNGGYDLVAMGCYGHSRLREMLLGGATREMLYAANIPTLFSR